LCFAALLFSLTGTAMVPDDTGPNIETVCTIDLPDISDVFVFQATHYIAPAAIAVDTIGSHAQVFNAYKTSERFKPVLNSADPIPIDTINFANRTLFFTPAHSTSLFNLSRYALEYHTSYLSCSANSLFNLNSNS
jgi:hypothetical protein